MGEEGGRGEERDWLEERRERKEGKRLVVDDEGPIFEDGEEWVDEFWKEQKVGADQRRKTKRIVVEEREEREERTNLLDDELPPVLDKDAAGPSYLSNLSVKARLC